MASARIGLNGEGPPRGEQLREANLAYLRAVADLAPDDEVGRRELQHRYVLENRTWPLSVVPGVARKMLERKMSALDARVSLVDEIITGDGSWVPADGGTGPRPAR